jgi:hypothetical protein
MVPIPALPVMAVQDEGWKEKEKLAFLFCQP